MLQQAWENNEFERAKELIPQVLSIPLDQQQQDPDAYANTMRFCTTIMNMKKLLPIFS